MFRRAVRSALAGAVLSGALLSTLPAAAQSAVCQQGPELLGKRRALIERLNVMGKSKKMDANVACKNFSELVSNGNATLKWMEANGDWCQVPQNLREGMKADNERASKFKSQACGAANKMAEMAKKARQQQQQGGGGNSLLGGDGLTGPQRMPQGAL